MTRANTLEMLAFNKQKEVPMKDYIVDYSVEISLKGGKIKNLEGVSGKAQGEEYGVYAQVSGQGEAVFIGFLAFSKTPIFDGFNAMFTRYVDNNKEGEAFLTGKKIHDVLNDLIKSLIHI